MIKQQYLICPNCGHKLKIDKTKTGSRNKQRGREFELQVAKKLTQVSGLKWNRTPLSGASIIAGDIYCLDKSLDFTIECKAREDITLHKILNGGILQNKTGEDLISNKQILIFKDIKTYIVMAKQLFLNYFCFNDSASAKFSYSRFSYKQEIYYIYPLDIFKYFKP